MSGGHGIRKRESAAMVASGSCGLAFAVQPPPFGRCSLAAALWPLLFGRCRSAVAVWPCRRLAVWPRWLGLCGAASASRAGCDGLFALGLIAEKPVKPCDGAVFGALDRLLKTERNTLHGSRVWLALLRLRLFQGAGSRAAWHFGQAGSRMRAALFAARAASLCRWRFSFHGAAFFMLLPTSFAMPHSLTGAAPLPR